MKFNKKIFSIVSSSVCSSVFLCSSLLSLTSCFNIKKSNLSIDSILFEPMTARKARSLSVNVGMGDAEIIQISQDNNYGGKDDFTILIDGGTGGAQGGKDASSPNGTDAIASALSWLKVTDIDFFVISHPHNDHMYALPEIILNYAHDNTKALIGVDAWNKKASSSSTVVMKKVSAALAKKNIDTYDSVEIIQARNQGSIKGFWKPADLIQFKNPITGKPIGAFSILGCTTKINSTSMNAYSVSNMFSFNNHKEIFAGDSEGITDNQLIEYYNTQVLKADIYKVSHHGSNTEGSNSLNWIKAIDPTYAIISSGAEDQYTLPDAATLENLLNANLAPENILGTQPFGKSVQLANQTSKNNQTIVNNWKNINSFLNSHQKINNNNNGATIRADGSKTTGSFVDLNSDNLDSNWTNVDNYYNMVMNGVGVLFDFSTNILKLNEIEANQFNKNAWNPSAWDNKNYTPVPPFGKKWYKLSSSEYNNNSGVPKIKHIK